MNFINRYLFVLLIMVCIACSIEQIEIQHPDVEPTLVLNAIISPGDEDLKLPGMLVARITKLQSLDQVYIPDSIKDALIVISDDSGLSDTLSYTPSGNQYVLDGFYKPGIKYHLKVLKDSFPILMANDVLPDRVIPDSITINPFIGVQENGNAVGGVVIYFKDPPDIDHFYEIVVNRGVGNECYLSSSESVITREYYYPINPEFASFRPTSLLFTDQSLSQKQKAIQISFDVGTNVSVDENGSVHEIPEGFIHVNFRTVSKNYYDYQTSLLDYRYNISGDALFGAREVKNIFTNVQNGYGIFASYQEAYKEIYIEKITY